MTKEKRYHQRFDSALLMIHECEKNWYSWIILRLDTGGTYQFKHTGRVWQLE